MSTDDKVYGQQIMALIQKLVGADGDITRNERSWLRLLKKEFGQDGGAPEFDPQILRATVEGKGEAEELIQLLLMVSLADGQTTPNEWELIQEIGRIVDVGAERLEELRSQTVLAVEP